MSRKLTTKIAGALLLAGSVTQVGCIGLTAGYNLGPFGLPIPVSPYFQDDEERQFHIRERYSRVPILDPIVTTGNTIALDPPSDDEVMQALENARPVRGGVPLLTEKQRNNVRIVKEKIADYIDDPRFIPAIGFAQLHHAHYKCTIYFEERTINGWPVPYTLNDNESMEVIYIDHNHFHRVADQACGPQAGVY
ncbi:MAG: hypothetical protein U0905_08625 [Pirellulales bacterium]